MQDESYISFLFDIVAQSRPWGVPAEEVRCLASGKEQDTSPEHALPPSRCGRCWKGSFLFFEKLKNFFHMYVDGDAILQVV